MTTYLSTTRVDNWVNDAKLRQTSQMLIQCRRSSSYPELHKDLSSFARFQYRAKQGAGVSTWTIVHDTILFAGHDGTNMACATA